MEPPCPRVIYYERLTDAIDELEALQDRNSFEHLLAATAIERTNSLDFADGPGRPYIHIFREDLPQDLPSTWFPRRMWVHGLHGQLTELPESEKATNTPDWSLSLTFSVTRDPASLTASNEFTLISTPLETVCTTTNARGDLLTVRTPADTGQRFLGAVLGSVMETEVQGDERYMKVFKSIISSPATPQVMNGTLAGLGQRFGEHRKITLSYLPHPQQGDRAVAVRVTESEDEGNQHRQLDYYLNRQIASVQEEQARHTAMLALRFEDIRHEGVVLSALERQYGKRFATDIPMEEMQFAVSLGLFDHSDRYRFDPRLNMEHEQYGLIAHALMLVIRPQLADYLQYDY